MSRTATMTTMVLILGSIAAQAASPPRFERVSDHFYFLQPKTEASNVGAMVTESGVLLINPPAEPDLLPVLDALRRLTQRSVRWVVHTDYRKEQVGGSSYFTMRGVQQVGSKDLRRLVAPLPPSTEVVPDKDAKKPSIEVQTGKTATPEEIRDHSASLPEILFGRQMRLYPDGVEVRLFALQQKARTGCDVVIYLPAEKVLQVGDLYMPGSYPEIDTGVGGGSALGWLEGMKHVVDTVPLLKTAIPPRTEAEKAAKAAQEEKSLEELVTVIPASGPRSNLKEMKAVLESAQKLRTEIARAIAAGRSRDAVLSLPSLGPYRVNLNFDAFAGLLFDELIRGPAK
jgi:hypothetical protein